MTWGLLKELREERKANLHFESYYINLPIYHFWFSSQYFGFKLASGIISLTQKVFVPTYLFCVITDKCITFLYILGSAIHYTHIISYNCLWNQWIKEKKYAFTLYLIITYSPVLVLALCFFMWIWITIQSHLLSA